MMRMLLACLMSLLGVFSVCADTVVSLMCEDQNSVLLRAVRAACSSLTSRVHATIRAPKPGVYMV